MPCSSQGSTTAAASSSKHGPVPIAEGQEAGPAALEDIIAKVRKAADDIASGKLKLVVPMEPK